MNGVVQPDKPCPITGLKDGDIEFIKWFDL
jgi:hypothetical protein